MHRCVTLARALVQKTPIPYLGRCPPTVTDRVVALCSGGSGGPDEGSVAQDIGSQASNIQYTIQNIPGNLADELSDLLLCNGALSATITEYRPEGKDEQEIFKERMGSAEFWNQCSVQCCFLWDDSTCTLTELRAQHREQIEIPGNWLDQILRYRAKLEELEEANKKEGLR